MSGLLAGKVWQSALAPELKPLAAALADIANDDGTSIYPSVDYICWLLGRTRRAIQCGLARLRREQILEIISGGKGGRFRPTEYRLIEGKLPIREAWRNRASVAPFDQNRAVCDTKPRSLRHERAQPAAHKPLRTVINKTGVNARPIRKTRTCSQCSGSGYVSGGTALEICMSCTPGGAGNAKEA